MNRDFLAEGAPLETPDGRIMAGRLSKLMNHCRQVATAVIHINHVHHPGRVDKGSPGGRFPTIGQARALCAATAGVEIWPEVAPRGSDIVIEKIRQSRPSKNDPG